MGSRLIIISSVQSVFDADQFSCLWPERRRTAHDGGRIPCRKIRQTGNIRRDPAGIRSGARRWSEWVGWCWPISRRSNRLPPLTRLSSVQPRSSASQDPGDDSRRSIRPNRCLGLSDRSRLIAANDCPARVLVVVEPDTATGDNSIGADDADIPKVFTNEQLLACVRVRFLSLWCSGPPHLLGP
jgi:hypothetical protein